MPHDMKAHQGSQAAPHCGVMAPALLGDETRWSRRSGVVCHTVFAAARAFLWPRCAARTLGSRLGSFAHHSKPICILASAGALEQLMAQPLSFQEASRSTAPFSALSGARKRASVP
eukprot:Amastigsp_a510845_29.p2 type:complete len:116 gc:universal Amastigsp_a510845_29:283-630(+)